MISQKYLSRFSNRILAAENRRLSTRIYHLNYSIFNLESHKALYWVQFCSLKIKNNTNYNYITHADGQHYFIAEWK